MGVQKVPIFDLGCIKFTSRGISRTEWERGQQGYQWYVQRNIDDRGQELYRLYSAELELKMPGGEDGLPLSFLILNPCCFFISGNTVSAHLVSSILKILSSLLLLVPHAQQIPSRKSQLVSSNSCLSSKVKLKCHVSRKLFQPPPQTQVITPSGIPNTSAFCIHPQRHDLRERSQNTYLCLVTSALQCFYTAHTQRCHLFSKQFLEFTIHLYTDSYYGEYFNTFILLF